MAKWRVVDVSPGYERSFVSIYAGAEHIAVFFDEYKAKQIVELHNALEETHALAPLLPTLEQLADGYRALKKFYPTESSVEHPIGQFQVYEAMVKKKEV